MQKNQLSIILLTTYANLLFMGREFISPFKYQFIRESIRETGGEIYDY